MKKIYLPSNPAAAKEFRAPESRVPFLYLPIFDAADRPDVGFQMTQHGPSDLANWLLRRAAEVTYAEDQASDRVRYLFNMGQLGVRAGVRLAIHPDWDKPPVYGDNVDITASLQVGAHEVQLNAARAGRTYDMRFGYRRILDGGMWVPREVTGSGPDADSSPITQELSGLQLYVDVEPYSILACRDTVTWTARMMHEIEAAVTFGAGISFQAPQVEVEVYEASA